LERSAQAYALPFISIPIMSSQETLEKKNSQPADAGDSDPESGKDDLTRGRVLPRRRTLEERPERAPAATTADVRALFAKLDKADAAKEEAERMRSLTQQMEQLTMKPDTGSVSLSNVNAGAATTEEEERKEMHSADTGLSFSDKAHGSDGSDGSWQKI
jgi:hypothetical protein